MEPDYSLRFAIAEKYNVVAHGLIKHGIGINSNHDLDGTPLHVAVISGNVEAVCMLLIYGADVSLTYMEKMPLYYAMACRNYRMMEVLDNYYDSDNFFNCLLRYIGIKYTVVINETRVSLTTFWDIFKTHVTNVNAIMNWTPIFSVIFERESFNFFKLFWPRVTKRMLDRMSEPLLYTFFHRCRYSDGEFLECCYFILDSPRALDVFVHFNTCHLWHLLAFIDNGTHKIARTHRLDLIYTFLSFGMQITVQDIVYVFHTNGYNEEIMALIYGGVVNKKIFGRQKYCIYPLTTFIFVFEENSNIKTICKMFRNLAYRSFAITIAQTERFLYCLRFFSFSRVVRQKLIKLCKIHISPNKAILAKIEQTQSVPSLLEITRNETRHLIKKKYKIKKSYQFHDVVKNLNVPQRIKDILIFKTPIYN